MGERKEEEHKISLPLNIVSTIGVIAGGNCRLPELLITLLEKEVLYSLLYL
jgi:hypothetical protein